MATCKDCLHIEACTSFAKMLFDAFDVSEDDTQELSEKCKGDATVCNNFADRSMFVELPCHTGKTAYAFFSDTMMEGVVIGFEITASKLVLTTICLDDGDTFSGRFGINVFLSKEKAERALKEREENEQQPHH